MSAPPTSSPVPPSAGRLAGRSEVVLRRSRTFDIVALVTPIFVAVGITVVGHLFLTELILLLSLPFLLAGTRTRIDRPMKLILVCGLLWLASQILTDFVHHTPF